MLDRKGLMGWVCLSVCLDGCMSRLYCSTCETIIMSKGNKGNRPERKLETQVKRAALDISFYIK
jgi:ferredoxin